MIADNIIEELKRHDRIVGKVEQEAFSMETDIEIQHLKIESPIEQLLYSTLKCLFRVNYVFDYRRQDQFMAYQIVPQHQIGNYRADFLIRYFSRKDLAEPDSEIITKEVIVECDSQEFHERTERERRYEKARDRFMQKIGYKVIRFTGAEILQDSFSVAAEIITFLTNETKEETLSALANYDYEE